MRRLIALTCILLSQSGLSFFDVGPLLQLVAGQIQEIEKLSETIGVAKDQVETLKKLNEGIDRSISQIQNIEAIMDRAKGLDPTQIRSISDLNELLSKAKQTKEDIEELMQARIRLSNRAISQSALQSETAYSMGQEMLGTGASLARESESASPGRAAQISAAATSAQMLGQGIELQTLSQLVQLQAMSLEIQKAALEKELMESKGRDYLLNRELRRSKANTARLSEGVLP